MLDKILNQLDQLSHEELSTLNSEVVKVAKAKMRVESIIKATTLKVGQIVEINQKKHKGQKFIIKKVNRTKCVIVSKDNAFESYTCPISMLICS